MSLWELLKEFWVQTILVQCAIGRNDMAISVLFFLLVSVIPFHELFFAVLWRIRTLRRTCAPFPTLTFNPVTKAH